MRHSQAKILALRHAGESPSWHRAILAAYDAATERGDLVTGVYLIGGAVALRLYTAGGEGESPSVSWSWLEETLTICRVCSGAKPVPDPWSPDPENRNPPMPGWCTRCENAWRLDGEDRLHRVGSWGAWKLEDDVEDDIRDEEPPAADEWGKQRGPGNWPGRG